MRLFHAPSRRHFLRASGALFAWANLPKLARAAGRDPRFLAIILRGGLDGLAAVAPVGDPDWVALRGDDALTLDGATLAPPALPLDDFFALHPAMPNLHRLFQAREAIIVHACATPYRERAHGDGQKVLESGLPAPVLSWSAPTPPRIDRAIPRASFAEAAGAAAKFLAQPDGPRVGALALDGWDTHDDEGIANGRLARLLGALDAALVAVKTDMGPAWRNTVVVAVSEFGRSARLNEAAGTDHGTATVALIAGGALKGGLGGRVIADWPGLKAADLYEGRDLKPTIDLRAVLKGLLRDHLGVDERALAEDIFPGSEAVAPMAGLVG